MTDPDPQLTERLVELTRDLILIPGTADRPDDRERCYAFCRNHIEGLPGIRIREYRSGGIPCFVAMPEGIDEPEVLMAGHLDVVTHSDPLAYTSQIKDGRIIGPGAGDMKGALAILLELFRRMHQAHPGISLGLAVTADEEIGGEHGIRYLLHDVGLRAGTAMIPDGGTLDSITVEEKGIMHLQLHCQGKAAHGSRPWLGDNALEKLVDRVAVLRAWFADQQEGRDWFPTCALTRLHTSNRSCNRIPPHAEAMLDIRFTPPHTFNQMYEKVGELLGPEVGLETVLHAEPLQVEADPLYMEACASRLGRPALLGRDDGASDARFFAPRGIPVIISRPKVDLLHSVDEWIDIQSMGVFYEICQAYLERKLCGAT